MGWTTQIVLGVHFFNVFINSGGVSCCKMAKPSIKSGCQEMKPTTKWPTVHYDVCLEKLQLFWTGLY